MRLDHNAYYHAMQSHDRRFDGWSLVGMAFTGAYCCPVCVVRTPLEKNCCFFTTAAAVGRTGFQPRLRCRPELVPDRSPAEMSSNLARAAARMVDEGFLQKHDLAALAAAVGMTDHHLRHIFRAEFDVSPIEYTQTQRLLFTKRLLIDTVIPVSDAAFAADFGSVRRLNGGFSGHYGFAPTRLRLYTTTPRAEDGPTLMLGYRPPFARDVLLTFLQVYAVGGIEVVDADSYARTITIDHGGMRHIGWLHACNVPRRRAVAPILSFGLLYVMPPVLARTRRLFGLDCQSDLIDMYLGMLAVEMPGLCMPDAADDFEIAAHAIVGQVISLARTRRIFSRMTTACGVPLQRSREGSLATFPNAAALANIDARVLPAQAGLQASRAATVVEPARTIDCSRLRLEPLVPLVPTLVALQALPGVGEWTVQYVVMRVLSWPNASPLGDYVLRKRLVDAGGTLSGRHAMVERVEPRAP